MGRFFCDELADFFFSVAVNDCGRFVNGVGLGTRFEGTYNVDGAVYPVMGNCEPYIDYQSWNASTIQAYYDLALASMDALQVRFHHIIGVSS